MNKVIYLLLSFMLVIFASCRKDFDTTPSQGNLEFSKQTVYLDTVFTHTSSSTYMLKVYNRSSKDISIPTISLAKPDSKYRLMVDGMTGVDQDNSGQGDGRLFRDVELLAKDSLFIFIETTVDISEANPTDFLYTDEILFASANGTQKVNLVTLIQDAVFLYPEKYADGSKETVSLGVNEQGQQVGIVGFNLDENDPIHGNELHFTREKPYVIYGYAAVPTGKELIIDAGARVHFHANSGLLVQNGGTLSIAQTGWSQPTDPQKPDENEVIFEADRLEPEFSDTPGQWGTVWLRSGSTSNINHLIVKNAVVGIYADNAQTTISNTQVYNSANVGILGRAAAITGTNIVAGLAGQACFATVAGGSYDFRHCTFNNNWSDPGQFAVLLSNYEQNPDNSITPNDLTQANFYNSIIYGSNRVELYLDKTDQALFNVDFKNCLVKFNDAGTTVQSNSLYDFLRSPQSDSNGNFINQDPNFENANRNKLRINPQSRAADKADAAFLVPTDLLGVTRTLPADLGAYESADF